MGINSILKVESGYSLISHLGNRLSTPQGQHVALPAETCFSGCIDGQLFCVSRKGTVTRVDPATGAVIRQACFGKETTCATFALSSIVISTDDGEIFLVDPSDLSVRKDTLKGNAGEITALAVSPDGRFLAAGDNQRRIHLYSLSNNQVDFGMQDYRLFGLAGGLHKVVLSQLDHKGP